MGKLHGDSFGTNKENITKLVNGEDIMLLWAVAAIPHGNFTGRPGRHSSRWVKARSTFEGCLFVGFVELSGRCQ